MYTILQRHKLGFYSYTYTMDSKTETLYLTLLFIRGYLPFNDTNRHKYLS